METDATGTFFQVGDQVRIKRTGETGKVDATDGGVVYVLMDTTNEAKVFSASVDEDAFLELLLPEARAQESGALREIVPVRSREFSAPPKSIEARQNDE